MFMTTDPLMLNHHIRPCAYAIQAALDDLLGQPELATKLLTEHPRAIAVRHQLCEEIKMIRAGVEVTNRALGRF
jgi:hypothetical protein